MEKVSSSERFKTLMNERNLRQVDILNLVLPYCKKYNVKMNKSDISQYVSGKDRTQSRKTGCLRNGTKCFRVVVNGI